MTQEYLSHRIVTAWSEARHTGLIPEGAPASYMGAPKAGFAVKDEQGVMEWYPAEDFNKFHIALGNISHLPLFQQRLLAEAAELRQRTDGLKGFLMSSVGKSAEELRMSPKQLILLNDQNLAMQNLLSILDARIEEMSNPAGIAELFKPDPLLEHEQGYIEPMPALQGKLGEGDDWLHKTLQRASEADGKARDYFAEWTGTNGPTLTAKMPLFPTKYNLFGLLQGQGELSHDCDMTDTVGSVLVKELIDADGKVLEVVAQHYRETDVRHIDLIARTDDLELEISVNRETAVVTLDGKHTNGEPLPAGLVLFLSVSLHNANRRPAQ